MIATLRPASVSRASGGTFIKRTGVGSGARPRQNAAATEEPNVVPFQRPTGLADGLGPESAPGFSSIPAPRFGRTCPNPWVPRTPASAGISAVTISSGSVRSASGKCQCGSMPGNAISTQVTVKLRFRLAPKARQVMPWPASVSPIPAAEAPEPGSPAAADSRAWSEVSLDHVVKRAPPAGADQDPFNRVHRRQLGN